MFTLKKNLKSQGGGKQGRKHDPQRQGPSIFTLQSPYALFADF